MFGLMRKKTHEKVLKAIFEAMVSVCMELNDKEVEIEKLKAELKKAPGFKKGHTPWNKGKRRK